MRHLLEREGMSELQVASAGVGAMAGQVPSSHAVKTLADLNIDITHQRSQMISASNVSESDWIFGMTQGHVDVIASMFPEAATKTLLIRHFVDNLNDFEKILVNFAP